MPKKQTTAPSAPASPPPSKLITSVAELQGLIDAPIKCRFQLDGKTLEVELIRLKPSMQESVRAVTREVVPPFNNDRKDYDMMHPTFLARREKANITARAVALYAGCPIIAQAKPGLADKDSIFAHVQGLFSEYILQLLYMTLTGEGVSLDERTNFTSPLDSGQS